MKKLLLFIYIFLCSVATYAEENEEYEEVEMIDGRCQDLIDAEDNVDPEYFLIKDKASERDLFEIVNFQNISSNLSENIKDYRGKIVILHFWATWCGYCVEEMQWLNKLSEILIKKEIQDDIIILPVSVDNENPGKIKSFYKQRNLQNLSMYQDKENKYLPKLGYTTLPTTFIIGKNGKQITVAKGAVPWNNKAIVNYLESLR